MPRCNDTLHSATDAKFSNEKTAFSKSQETSTLPGHMLQSNLCIGHRERTVMWAVVFAERGREIVQTQFFFIWREFFGISARRRLPQKRYFCKTWGFFTTLSVPSNSRFLQKILMAIFQNHPSAYLEVSFFLNNCCPEKRSNLFVWWVRKMIYWQPSRFYA